MYKVSVSYLNQQHWLYKKSANTSASASGNISIQCYHLLFKSVVLAIQKVGQYVGIGIGIDRPWEISMYKVSISYLNQQCWLYKKSANTSALASGNISIQCYRLLFKSVVSAIQKVSQYVGIGLGEYQYTMSPFVI